jgi:hypothetical protein
LPNCFLKQKIGLNPCGTYYMMEKVVVKKMAFRNNILDLSNKLIPGPNIPKWPSISAVKRWLKGLVIAGICLSAPG